MGKEIQTSRPARERGRRSVVLLLLGLGALLVFALWPQKAPRPVKSAVDDSEFCFDLGRKS